MCFSAKRNEIACFSTSQCIIGMLQHCACLSLLFFGSNVFKPIHYLSYALKNDKTKQPDHPSIQGDTFVCQQMFYVEDQTKE